VHGGGRGALGDDEIAPGGGRREHAVVRELVGARMRHESGQSWWDDAFFGSYEALTILGLYNILKKK